MGGGYCTQDMMCIMYKELCGTRSCKHDRVPTLRLHDKFYRDMKKYHVHTIWIYWDMILFMWTSSRISYHVHMISYSWTCKQDMYHVYEDVYHVNIIWLPWHELVFMCTWLCFMWQKKSDHVFRFIMYTWWIIMFSKRIFFWWESLEWIRNWTWPSGENPNRVTYESRPSETTRSETQWLKWPGGIWYHPRTKTEPISRDTYDKKLIRGLSK